MISSERGVDVLVTVSIYVAGITFRSFHPRRIRQPLLDPEVLTSLAGLLGLVRCSRLCGALGFPARGLL